MCQVAHLGRLPHLAPLTRGALTKAFDAIDLDTIRGAL
jgi:hypothetical protein